MTDVMGSVALVTGESRGIGKALGQALYERGAAKVYATARNPKAIARPDAVPLALKVTGQQSVAAAAAAASDVTVLINNAGVLVGGSFLDSRRGIGVTGLHAGYVDTDMTAGLEAPRISPHRVAQQPRSPSAQARPIRPRRRPTCP